MHFGNQRPAKDQHIKFASGFVPGQTIDQILGQHDLERVPQSNVGLRVYGDEGDDAMARG